MADTYIRQATVEDAIHVALNLRDADKAEIWASNMNLPLPCLMKAYNRSGECRAFVVDGEVACVFGVAPLSILGGVGSPWMLGTDLIIKNKRAFLRESQNAVLDVCKPYYTLINYVDERNKLSLNWLKWVGFDVDEEAKPHGPFNMLFHRFVLRK